MSIRKAQAWDAFWTVVLIVVLALIVEVLTMPKYNGYDLPELPASEYQNAYIAVSGNTAYLYFVDKKGYIEVDPNGFGNTYTLGLTTTDPYDESKILFAEKYMATIGGDSWTAEELPDLSGVYDIPAYAQFSLPCEIDGPVWSNVTLLDQYGNVFIEGSKPIDVVAAARRRYSSTLGYLMGVCAPPLKLPDKQPTAYSYNGVVLPKLPEWDETVYPYAWITPTWANAAGYTNDYFLTALKRIEYKYEDGEPYLKHDYDFVCYQGDINGWEVYQAKMASDWMEVGVTAYGYFPAIWSNFDILNEDGTIYLSASEPTPI